MGPKRKKVWGSNYCRPLVADFSNLLEELEVPADYLKYGHAMTDIVFKKLKSSGPRFGFKVARTILAGSIAKGTEVSYGRKNSDFDLVVLLKGLQPPFSNIFSVLASLINQIEGVSILNTTEIALQFKYSSPAGDIKFDLVPGTSYADKSGAGENLAEKQCKMALQVIKRGYKDNKICPDRNRLYSSSLCETTLEFVQSYVNDDFYRDVVRLAKYWNSRLELQEYIPGRTYMIELIALSCHDNKKENICKISGFRRFLKSMADFENVYVDYDMGLVRKNDFYYRQAQGQGVMSWNDVPVVIDPGNPYNNLAGNIYPADIQFFMDEAMNSLNILEEVQSLDGYQCYENVIDEIF